MKEQEIERHGMNAIALGDQQRADLLWCEEQLAPYGLTLRKGIETLLPRLEARQHGPTVANAVKKLLASKRAAGLSERHLYTLENRLGRFKADYEKRSLASFGLRVQRIQSLKPGGRPSGNKSTKSHFHITYNDKSPAISERDAAFGSSGVKRNGGGS